MSGTGHIYADGTLHSPAADFAEYLPKRDPAHTLEPGDVVGLFPDGLSKRTAGAQRVLVITTKPIVLGNAPGGEGQPGHAAVAMLGQAPVKVRGPVQAGDYLVASGDDGTAIAIAPAALAVEDYGRVVGTALEASHHDGVEAVLTSVGLGNDGLWARALEERETRITALEQRLAKIEAILARSH